MYLITDSETAILYTFLILASILIAYKIGQTQYIRSKKWAIGFNDDSNVVYRKYVAGKWQDMVFEKVHYAKGFPRHVIYIEKDWSGYPEWVVDDQEVIKLRLNKRFKHPEYTFVDKETNQAIDLDTWFSEDEDHSELLDR